MSAHIQHVAAGTAIAHNSNVTEIQAKAGTKRKRISNDNGIEDIPWTAARCNRLLRTISSRVSILERIGRADRRKLQTATPVKQRSDPRSRNEVRLVDMSSSTTLTPSKDPEWLPQDSKNNDSATYGGKPRLRNSTGATGEISGTKHWVGFSFPTPFVKRILQSEPASQSDVENSNVRAKYQSRSKQLPIQTSSSGEAHRNLVSAFESLLICTQDHDTVNNAARLSLRSMALRKVPDLIEMEESQQKDADKFDIASSLYTELENLGTNVQGGWSGLQDVVRAHGIRKLEIAVSRRLLPSHVVKALIRASERRNATCAGQKLLLAAAFSARAADSEETVDLLLDFCSRNSCREFLFRALARLLQEKDTFFTTVSERPTLWKECVTALLDSSSRTAAAAFLEAFVLRSEIIKASPGTTATTSQTSATFMNVIALATAMAMSIGEPDSAEQSIAALLFRSATTTFWSAGHSDLGRPLLLSNLVFLAMGFQPTANSCTLDVNTIISNVLTGGPTDSGSTTGNSAEFVCEVSRCLDCLSKGAGEELFHTITRGFLTLAASTNEENGKLLQKLALDTASAYLEKSNSKTSEIFVDEIESVVLFGTNAISSTPKPKTSFIEASYRWEAGIQEWIAQTPSVMQKGKFAIIPKETDSLSIEQQDQPQGHESFVMSPTADVLSIVSPQAQSKLRVDISSVKSMAATRSLPGQQATTETFSKRSSNHISSAREEANILHKRARIASRKQKVEAKRDFLDDTQNGCLVTRKSGPSWKSMSPACELPQALKIYTRISKLGKAQGRRVALRPITNQTVRTPCEVAQNHHSCLNKIDNVESDFDELSMGYARLNTRPNKSGKLGAGRTQPHLSTSGEIAWSSKMHSYDKESEDELAI